MNITSQALKRMAAQYGQSFYILDSRQFAQNYRELEKAFRDIYPNSHIAYSYKTNYIPKLCKLVDQLGGLAEVVSDMEYQIALQVGVLPSKIYFNGPYKNSAAVEELLLAGGTVNIDSHFDLRIIKEAALKHPGSDLSVGIRCNFDIQDDVISRFGFDIDGNEFVTAIKTIRSMPNVKLNGIHCHFATRSIGTWSIRTTKMLTIAENLFAEPPLFISLGGGLYGKMADSLKAQFDEQIPSYQDYAKAAATEFRRFFGNIDPVRQPMAIIEPGSALVSDAMKFVARVISIKDVRGKKIATLLGSTHNISAARNKKNPPITVYHDEDSQYPQIEYNSMDFAGYTCIESDYLYRGYCGKVAVGDYIVFDNVGSYSIVFKPPFILPNVPVIEYEAESTELIKEQETFGDLFHTFNFEF